MNIYDGMALTILLLGIVIGYGTGLMRSAFRIVSWVISLALSFYLYPHVSRFLRGLGLLGLFTRKLSEVINLDFLTEGASLSSQMEMLQRFPQSNFILKQLQANNNPEAYGVFSAGSIKEYVCAFFANMIINLISLFLIWLVARLLLSAISSSIRVVERLPAIRTLNKAGGAAFGFAGGVIFIWAALCVLNFFFLDPKYDRLFLDISTGAVSGLFYSHNPLFKALSSIIP
jgi:uncharacterized membrane protein required for colicin V production